MNDFLDAFNAGKDEKEAKQAQHRASIDEMNKRVAEAKKLSDHVFTITDKITSDAGKALKEQKVGFEREEINGGVRYIYIRTSMSPNLRTAAYVEFYVRSGDVLVRTWPEKGEPQHEGDAATFDEARATAVITSALRLFAASNLPSQMPAPPRRR